jgi:serine/threonine protein kinase
MNGEQPLPSAKERDIFLEALDQPTSETRAAYLERACGNDHTLRASVETLLRNYINDDFLEIPALTMRRSSLVTEKPGDHIGHYKLLQKIGDGGWGIVYKAEQEEPFRRFVALKIIKIGMDTPQVIARFEVERQALAMMEHPNIAKVFDAGATDTGRPYFVMELVKGIPITQYCDEQKLSIQERLELFVPVCQAIQHAHQKEIVHRDIKPSNVLVALFDGRPVPKVIDFGVAKATQQLTNKPLVTADGQFLGTPVYMSPEQAGSGSQSIDARSDIYSLGVLLYELLVGQPPFPADLPNDEILRVIRQKEPLRPSVQFSKMTKQEGTQIAQRRQTKPSSLLQLLNGDLDWILIKCLDKDRAHRYQTANELAAEIQHYLKREPITARPPSRLYQFQKLVQRNKLRFAASVIIIMLILGIIFSLIVAPTLITKKILTTFGIDNINVSRLLEEMRQRVKSHSTPFPIVKKSPPIINSTKPTTIPTLGGTGGQIRILSGTGDFASVSDANNVLNVSPGATLNGTIELSVLNLGPGDAVAPLIFTPSWGDHSSSWRQISRSVPTGQSQQQTQVSFVAPTTPGVYHIIFAVDWEVGGNHVASGTSWAIGKDLGYGWVNNFDVWNDGNDIADFNAAQLSSAQLNGWTTNSEMNGPDATHSTRWYQQRPYPADAITLVVTGGVSTSATESTTSQSVSTPTIDGNPQITSVEFRENAGSYTLIINGQGFGIMPGQTLPFRGDTSFFRIMDGAQIGFGEWGFSGDAKALIYESWSDTQIKVGGFAARPGDAVQFALWNPSSGAGAAWGGNVPGGLGTPEITSATFSGAGQNLRIIIRGSGFGNAPVSMPYSGDLNQFILGDLRTHCGNGSALFEAGAERWGHGSPDSLTLNYQSWSDNKVVINGFRGSYGQDCDTLQNGDPVTIIIWNSSAGDQIGPQTAWGGFVH